MVGLKRIPRIYSIVVCPIQKHQSAMTHHTVCLYVRESLDATIPEHWIGHGGF